MSRPDPRPDTAAPGGVPQRRRLLPGPFLGWAAVGALWTLCLASLLSIGIFLMPVALIVTVVMCMGYTRPDGWPGGFAGAGLVGCYLAFLHRHGPGRFCTSTPTSMTCTDELDPWVFLGIGIGLIALCALVSWRWYTRAVKPRQWRSRA